ncbi:hypothetical protein GCM10023235_09530 [Kitasatospora terrestris]|uniref:Ferritin-like diiron domain-containing protein n=1 Tax=Kitasatospora terrestris TaxID=258051 RepID=A0ABP9DFZ6_9ACTN
MTEETAGATGTKDQDYDLIWYVEACLSNALRLETYVRDAERAGDGEVAELFRKAQADSRKGAEIGKRLLAGRLGAAGAAGGAGTPADTAGRTVREATVSGGAGEGAATVPGEGTGVDGPAPAEDAELPQDPTTP